MQLAEVDTTDWFKFVPIHLDRHALHNQVQGQDHSQAIALAHYDAFHAGQGAAANASSLSDYQVRVRLGMAQVKAGPKRLYLKLR
jgi:hypothetical protein